MKKNRPNNTEEESEQGQVMAVRKSIYLVGEINPTSTGALIAALHEADSEPGHITISICSGGGWVEGGLAMFDAIRATKNKVVTLACGAVYSSAVLPFEAGDLRIAYPSSRLFLHDMSIGMSEVTLSSARTAISESQILYKLYCKHVSDRSGLPLDKVSEMLKNETYLDVKAAKALNLLDSVIAYKKPITIKKTAKTRLKAKKK